MKNIEDKVIEELNRLSGYGDDGLPIKESKPVKKGEVYLSMAQQLVNRRYAEPRDGWTRLVISREGRRVLGKVCQVKIQL